MLGMTSVTLVRNSGGCSLVTRFSPAADLTKQRARLYFYSSTADGQYALCSVFVVARVV